METMKADKRSEMGSRKSRRLRDNGKLPGIIYGHGQPPMSVTLGRKDFETAVHKGERLLQLDLEGTNENVLIKEVQYDAMQQEIIHIDMARVNLDERVKVSVAIVLRGTAAGAADGGTLQQSSAVADIECLVTAIPDEIRVSVADMKIDDVMHMKDLPLPEGARLLSDPNGIVCSVTLLAEEVTEPVAAAAEEGAGEPEVIGAKKEEAAEGEAAAAPKEKKKE